jgi:hypothetical protein
MYPQLNKRNPSDEGFLPSTCKTMKEYVNSEDHPLHLPRVKDDPLPRSRTGGPPAGARVGDVVAWTDPAE